MNKRISKILFLIPPAALLVGCVSNQQITDQISKSIEDNPEILFRAIEKNPAKFFSAVSKATVTERMRLASTQSENESLVWAKRLNNPFKPILRKDESIRGPADAPLKIFIYSDFQCPYCVRGSKTVNELMQRYKGKIQTVYKHLPLPMHPQALIAAKYYEGLRLQNSKFAFKFHDRLFSRPNKLAKGETYFRGIAKSLGADLKRLEKDIMSKEIQDRIDTDMKEAQRFGFQGTPAFVVNGVPLTGAQPIEKFEKLIQLLKKEKDLKI